MPKMMSSATSASGFCRPLLLVFPSNSSTPQPRLRHNHHVDDDRPLFDGFGAYLRFCLRFLEVVPWTQDDEARVLALIPHLSEDEAKDLITRVSGTPDLSEEMLYGLILALIHNSSMKFVKAFVEKLLQKFGSRDLVKRSRSHSNHEETEAIQRLNLHTTMTNGKHLVWLMERMIKLRVADSAVKDWSEQPAFAAFLQRTFRDDAWRNIVSGLPSILHRCTLRLANAVPAGTILVDAQKLPSLSPTTSLSSSPSTLSKYPDLPPQFLFIYFL
ncbi:BTB/POZ domain-containing protein [Pyrus ussuriensis x Pyrus communis]|uniref:BTB/POZ domain-containing protein n=1 Tax=Pyrus ussuriensis x Pyrus communis TaxID=2448454 RepID=A0A5N5GG06_9ROSA|nr:BTB/POZ domain-containing protein [Pyrus ussuriensis x Pyrus communis]